MQIITIDGPRAVIADAAVGALRARLRGRVLIDGDPDYDRARVVFNGLFDRRPALIAQCRDAADVAEAVRFAVGSRLLTAVRGGGHSIAGHSTCDGGVVIDLSPMRAVAIDPTRQTARVGGGATWADMDRATQMYGLATPGGVVSHTGVAGLTLGGGIGWLRNQHGLACDNLVSAEIVTADGRRTAASETEHPDLLWALRGGGGNFGVVTELEFALHRVGPLVASVSAMYPLDATRHVMSQWREWVKASPREATTEVVAWTVPATSPLPPAVRGRSVLIVAGLYAGDPDEGLRVLQPLGTFGEPLQTTAAAIPYVDAQQAFDAVFPHTGEVLGYWKSLFLEDLSNPAIDVIADAAANRSSPSTMVLVAHLGAGVRDVSRTAAAFAARDAAFIVNLMGDWRDARETARHVAWVREAWERLRPHSNGASYLNALGDEDSGDRLVRAAFAANYDRIVEIKLRYDPTNFFRLNQNIRPTPGGVNRSVRDAPVGER